MAKTTLKFRDTLTAYNSVCAEIQARRFSPIYLLMGEEGYFIDMVAQALAESILDAAERDFNQITVYGAESSPEQIINLSRQMPMMGTTMVVIVKEAQRLRQIERLGLYASSPSPSTILIICHKEKGVDKRSTLYKSTLKSGVVLESVRPRDYEIEGWLSSFVASKRCSITPKALSMLVGNLGTDISKISNELTKLLLTLPEGTTKIEDVQVEQNIGISKDFNNFELNKALLGRNLSRALFIADHFAHNSKANPLLLTIMAMFSSFKQLFTLNYLMWLTRQKGERFPSDGELMRILKVGNPYAIAELKSVAPQWPNSKVFAVLGFLREYDAKSKGINTGGASEGELLRELILKILSA